MIAHSAGAAVELKIQCTAPHRLLLCLDFFARRVSRRYTIPHYARHILLFDVKFEF